MPTEICAAIAERMSCSWPLVGAELGVVQQMARDPLGLPDGGLHDGLPKG